MFSLFSKSLNRENKNFLSTKHDLIFPFFFNGDHTKTIRIEGIKILLTTWLSMETTLSPTLNSFTPSPTSTTSPATSVTVTTRRMIKLGTIYLLVSFNTQVPFRWKPNIVQHSVILFFFLTFSRLNTEF